MKKILKNKKLISVFMVCLMTAAMALPAFAEEATPVTFDNFSGVLSALTGQISVTQILGIFAGLAGVCVGLVFMWWGIRKAVGALMSAFKKGRLSI